MLLTNSEQTIIRRSAGRTLGRNSLCVLPSADFVLFLCDQSVIGGFVRTTGAVTWTYLEALVR